MVYGIHHEENQPLYPAEAVDGVEANFKGDRRVRFGAYSSGDLRVVVLQRGAGLARKVERVGQRFSRLLVVARDAPGKNGCTRWLCRCDCGKETVVTNSNLTSSQVKSCGCLASEWGRSTVVDRVGKRYGRLVVVARAPERKKKLPEWVCRCDCGGTAVVSGANLESGGSKSCGCLVDEYYSTRRRPPGVSAFNRRYYAMVRGAEKRNLVWGLTKDFVRGLIQQPCHYCGSPPGQSIGRPDFNGEALTNGIDRIDSALGYVVENVVPCCWPCNAAKGRRTGQEFLAWAHRFARFLGYEKLNKEATE